MEGNVGVRASRFWRLDGRDNGEAEAEGQPPPKAFPKAFVGVFAEISIASARIRSSAAI
jgi:hypothetical protein